MPQRRRLAFCITDLDPGGAERALVEVVSRLDPADWEPAVYCLGPDALLANVLRERGVPVECLGARSVLDAGVVNRLTSRLREFRPELLQSFLFHANVVSRWAGHRAGVPHIVSGLRVAEGQHRWHCWVDRLTGVRNYDCICVSEGVANFARQELKIPAARVHIIPNGVEVSAFANSQSLPGEELGLPPGARYLLAIGRLHPQKGFDLLLAAFAELKEQFSNVHLLIAGDGPERTNLERLRQTLGIEQSVHFLGRHQDIPRLLAGAELFVLSSRWEGMPNVVLEAVAAGVPVVTTPVEGIVDLTHAGVRLNIVNPLDSRTESGNTKSAMGTALERQLSGRGISRADATKSQSVVRECFTWESISRRYAALYRQLLGPTQV